MCICIFVDNPTTITVLGYIKSPYLDAGLNPVYGSFTKTGLSDIDLSAFFLNELTRVPFANVLSYLF